MRLMNARTMKLEEFSDKKIPQYAILSHTRGEDEVTFRDFHRVRGPRRTSEKIAGCCTQALRDGYDYVWINICCVDKTRSAELSEATNSMFAWYARAGVCYVYLSDVISDPWDVSDSPEFKASRWFTRGWTLQELLAPSVLKFYNSSWGFLGYSAREGESRHQKGFNLSSLLSQITDIPEMYIDRSLALNRASVAEKMRWASARQTTCAEDIAYCLLGLFGVAMPMIYGEGTKAFARLQEEIMKAYHDESIFAWDYLGSVSPETSCLARSPANFAHCRQYRKYSPENVKSGHFLSTNKGVLIEMQLVQLITGDYFGRLNCLNGAKPPMTWVVIPLIQVSMNDNTFYRAAATPSEVAADKYFAEIEPKLIYLSTITPELDHWHSGIRLSEKFSKEIIVRNVYPPNWSMTSGTVAKTDYWYQRSEFGCCVQTILLDCLNKLQEHFVIKIHYSFEPIRSMKWDEDTFVGHNYFRTPEATMLAARMPSSDSLLKVLINGENAPEGKIEWQENFVFDQPKRLILDGYTLGSYTRQLRLDYSDEEWIVGIVRVNGPDTASDGTSLI
jgi:hypothetical protein